MRIIGQDDNSHNQPLLQSDENDNRGTWASEENEGEKQPFIEVSRDDNPNATSDVAALMHLLKGNLGTGLLGLPWALKHAGILVGPLLLVLMGIACTHCMQLLVKASKHFCRQQRASSLDYSNVMTMAVRHGPIECLKPRADSFKYLVNTFLLITQLGFCCVYFVFMSQNIRQVMINYFPEHTPSARAIMGMLLLPVTLLCFIKHLKVLAWFSMIANIATLVALIIILTYLFDGGLHPAKTVVLSKPITELPVFFGTAIFAFEGIGVVLPIENQMRNPSHFRFILPLGMAMVCSLYLFIAVTGYTKFGDDICGSITLNLPYDQWIYETAKLLFTYVIFVTYAIQFYVPCEIMWPAIQRKVAGRSEWPYQMIMRTTLVVFTCACAVAIPFLGDYISLVGAVSSSVLALILPPAIDLLTFYQPRNFIANGDDDEEDSDYEADSNLLSNNEFGSNKMPWYLIFKNVVIIIIGIVGFLTGTFVSVQQIIKDMTSGGGEENDMCSGIAPPNMTTTPAPYDVTTWTSPVFNTTAPSATTVL